MDPHLNHAYLHSKQLQRTCEPHITPSTNTQTGRRVGCGWVLIFDDSKGTHRYGLTHSMAALNVNALPVCINRWKTDKITANFFCFFGSHLHCKTRGAEQPACQAVNADADAHWCRVRASALLPPPVEFLCENWERLFVSAGRQHGGNHWKIVSFSWQGSRLCCTEFTVTTKQRQPNIDESRISPCCVTDILLTGRNWRMQTLKSQPLSVQEHANEILLVSLRTTENHEQSSRGIPGSQIHHQTNDHWENTQCMYAKDACNIKETKTQRYTYCYLSTVWLHFGTFNNYQLISIFVLSWKWMGRLDVTPFTQEKRSA